MVLDLNDVIYYGRKYPNDKNNIDWWISIIDYSICETNTIIRRFGYQSHNEILQSGIYIPLFSVNIVELELKFLKENYIVLYNKFNKYCEKFRDYDIAFRVLIEENHLESSWHEYEKLILLDNAVKWCEKNRISYKIKKR